MEYEKLSYPEAIEKLASMYNFTLNYTKSARSGANLFKALETINDFYKKELTHTKKALEYLKNRGVSSASIEKFELGYAPEGERQIEYLKSHLIPLQDAIEAGILAKENRLYARMVERITFPIYSPNGAIVGFGGRTISNHPAKYLNTPQTKLFNKSKLLYGYHLAKESIFKKRRMIVCEGYLDVVMLHQAGFSTAVATLGTALTPQHLPILRRGEPHVILAYDGDKAGIAAALKAAKLLATSDIDGGVVIFPAGQDPADMVASKKIEELEKLFAHPKPFIEFVLEATVKSYDIKDPKEKQKALFAGTEFLRTLPELLQEEYRDYLAALLEILPSKIPIARSKSVTAPSLEVKDPKELSVIKTLLQHPHLIDEVLDIIDTSHFLYHKEEFEAVVSGNLDHPKLRAILLDEEIIPFEPEALREELFVFLIKYYEKRIKEVTKSSLPFEQKSFLIRKYRENILKLKRGELVVE
jgi:DNA primase